MRIIVASLNPVKLRAAQWAFEQMFPDSALRCDKVEVESGVSEQPMSDEETRRGARNRASNARDAHPTADYWVGLEGGVATIDETLTAFAWMSILDAHGRFGEARTVTLPLPHRIQSLINEGLELGDANDAVFKTLNSKQRGGAFGLLTNGLFTRESVYREALVVALVPLVNELYLSS